MKRSFYIGVDGRTATDRLYSTLDRAREVARCYHTRSDGAPKRNRVSVVIGDLMSDFYERWDWDAREWVDAVDRSAK